MPTSTTVSAPGLRRVTAPVKSGKTPTTTPSDGQVRRSKIFNGYASAQAWAERSNASMAALDRDDATRTIFAKTLF